MTRTILVADDEPAVRDFIGLVLDIAGYRVIEAHDGRQALELARAEHPDLILLDVMMPEMDGRDVCRAMRQVPGLVAMPIILFSGAREADVDWREAGAQRFIEKPFSAQHLRAVIASLLEAPPDISEVLGRPERS